jgi:hypothetical protein
VVIGPQSGNAKFVAACEYLAENLQCKKIQAVNIQVHIAEEFIEVGFRHTLFEDIDLHFAPHCLERYSSSFKGKA